MAEIEIKEGVKENIFYISVGIFFGFLAVIYPAAIFYFILVGFFAVLIFNKSESGQRRFLLNVFFIGLVLRLVAVLITHVLSVNFGLGARTPPFLDIHGGAIIGDDIGIHQRAWALTRLVEGSPLSSLHKDVLLRLDDFGENIHIYILSFFYYLFGDAPLLGKCFNSLLGVLTAILVYSIYKELFSRKGAKLACLLTAFSPTLFLWSITNLKDTAIILLLTLLLYSYVKLFSSRKIWYLLIPVLLFLFNGYRGQLVLSIITGFIIALAYNIKWNPKRLFVLALVLTILLSGYLVCKPCKDRATIVFEKININFLIGFQKGYVDSGGTVYKIYPERFYESSSAEPIKKIEIAGSLAKGLAFLMFKPFFWEIDNLSKLAYYPIGLAWGVLFPFFVVGFYIGSRYYLRKTIFLLFSFILIALVISLTEGNVGTMIRHRDMIAPIYIILASLGIIRLLYPGDFLKQVD